MLSTSIARVVEGVVVVEPPDSSSAGCGSQLACSQGGNNESLSLSSASPDPVGRPGAGVSASAPISPSSVGSLGFPIRAASQFDQPGSGALSFTTVPLSRLRSKSSARREAASSSCGERSSPPVKFTSASTGAIRGVTRVSSSKENPSSSSDLKSALMKLKRSALPASAVGRVSSWATTGVIGCVA